ncbi:exopolygalacturonase [Eucalyptus grandis]|uniref:exopolygalacturonase n=1 Tax=Eucalyptus grandis TaxID=71139 RepID=UPI00192EC631|nr:exopolygalacturonase [Eucalyptus grandis]
MEMDSSSCFCKICLLLCSVSVLVLANGVPSIHAQPKVFDVKSFGAIADGQTNDSKAFLDVWTQTCHYEGGSERRLLVPLGTYMVWPVVLKGPCAGPITVTVEGVVKGPVDKSTFSLDHWITFQSVDGLLIDGGGTFDGQGQEAWSYNNCSKNSNCKLLPVSLRFNYVKNALISNITSVNSMFFHFVVFSCDALEFRHVQIVAPDESSNTDGIHIGHSSRITIADSVISTGDDCVSVGPGSKGVKVVGVQCGPGHGFSVGSLGKYPGEADVSELSVSGCTMVGTQNGVRIKTWPSPLESSAYNISFQDITMNNVSNPIIINQEYCPVGGCSKEGTSASQLAVKIVCSPKVPCANINLESIDLTYPGGHAESNCTYVNGESRGVQNPPSCI